MLCGVALAWRGCIDCCCVYAASGGLDGNLLLSQANQSREISNEVDILGIVEAHMYSTAHLCYHRPNGLPDSLLLLHPSLAPHSSFLLNQSINHSQPK